MKRILIFAAYFYPRLGGYEKTIYALSSRLVEKGYEIDVVTCNTEETPVEEEVDGIRIHRLPVLIVGMQLTQLVYYIPRIQTSISFWEFSSHKQCDFIERIS